MINRNIDIISRHISGDRAYSYVDGITQYHRIQASQGYRDAANHCTTKLRDAGIETEILTYPANEHTKYWTQKMFQEYNCKNAQLYLTEPVYIELADYSADNLSIIQRSIAVDFRDKALEIIALPVGSTMDSCKSLSLRGRLIFVSDNPIKYMDWAIKEMGAVGIVSDYMSDVFVRQRNDLYDERLFLQFSWLNDAIDTKTFGFLLTPRQGDKLRTICTNMEEEYQKDNNKLRYPKARGYIDSELKDGEIENVCALIKGTTDEEIILVAHLCHAKACANDNASGCGGAIEIMRTINELINTGVIERPKRGIRLLLVPEVTGTYAYLAGREDTLNKIKAGIDLDMIGRKQEGESGLVGIMGVPDSTASFVLDLAAYIRDELSRDVSTFNIDSYVTPVRTEILEYVGGSDHYILCDPTVGIPCPIMMQWLDSNYHSSADTIEQLDPKVLKKTCSIGASYLYTLANLSTKDIKFIMLKARERFTTQLGDILKRVEKGMISYYQAVYMMQYQLKVYIDANEDYRRFFGGDELLEAEKIIDAEKQYLSNYANTIINEYKNNTQYLDESKKLIENYIDDKFNIKPIRNFKGPITFVGFADNLSEQAKKNYGELRREYPEFYGMNSMNDFILHRTDGENSVLDIAVLAGMEGKLFNPEYVYKYLSFLSSLDMVNLKKKKV